MTRMASLSGVSGTANHISSCVEQLIMTLQKSTLVTVLAVSTATVGANWLLISVMKPGFNRFPSKPRKKFKRLITGVESEGDLKSLLNTFCLPPIEFQTDTHSRLHLEMTQNILALIPARGGSKGIPRKNTMMLGGKPLIAHSILQAKASQRINRVIVSTDDAEISEVANEWGAEVPFIRPAQYAQDLSPDIDVFRHALNWLKEYEGYEPDMVVHLRPTGPVRLVDLIDQAVDLLADHPEADAVRSVSPALQTPYKMWAMTTEGYLQPLLRVEGVADCRRCRASNCRGCSGKTAMSMSYVPGPCWKKLDVGRVCASVRGRRNAVRTGLLGRHTGD